MDVNQIRNENFSEAAFTQLDNLFSTWAKNSYLHQFLIDVTKIYESLLLFESTAESEAQMPNIELLSQDEPIQTSRASLEFMFNKVSKMQNKRTNSN